MQSVSWLQGYMYNDQDEIFGLHDLKVNGTVVCYNIDNYYNEEESHEICINRLKRTKIFSANLKRRCYP
ncbi:MAG: hypothetical protein RML94_14640 [Bacteroidia bacterium]|nr:hypothetical protein [Bacteroidia bacterium]